MGSLPTKDLGRLAAAEGSFRSRATSYILTIVKGPEVPSSLKALTVLTLALFVLFSFEICILILHMFCAAIHIAGKVEPVWYLGAFGAEWFAGTALAIPLIPRLGSFGEAKRLEDSLKNIAQSKRKRRQTKRSPRGNSDSTKDI